MWAICRTEGCSNVGVGIDVGTLSYVDEETGETVQVDSVTCGPCGQPITELTDTEPPPVVDEEEEFDG